VTSAEAPARRGALARGWRNFRRWRRGRPFWGGLFTMLAGLEMLASGNMSLENIQIKVGLEGFQSYLIPAILILAGLLAWFTPGQRIFYGVLAALVSVYSLIGVNFGGFFLGMLLGIVGGSLIAAWAPVRLESPPADAADASDERDDQTDDRDGSSPGGDDGEAGDRRPDATVDELLTGPLTDVLPTSTSSPIPHPRPSGMRADQADDPTGTEKGGDEAPPAGGALPRRAPRLFAITLVPVALTAAAVAALPTPQPALAEPCPVPKLTLPGTVTSTAPAKRAAPNAGPAPIVKDTATSGDSGTEGGRAALTSNDTPVSFAAMVLMASPDAGATVEATPSPEPSATPTPEPTPSADPSPTPQPSPTSTPSSTPSSTAAPTQSPSASPPATPKPSSPSPCPSPSPPKMLQADSGQPIAKQPGRMTGTRLSMLGLAFDGIVDLPTADGTIRVLQFSMDRATTTNFELRLPHSSGVARSIKSSELTVAGNVTFHTNRFSGKFGGVLPLELTPDSPELLLALVELLEQLPDFVPVDFTDVDISLVHVGCDSMTAKNLHI